MYSLQDSKAREIKVKLAEAKWMIYLKGQCGWVYMLALDAKPLICKMLEEKAVSYSEPEKKVMLWSGDDCVVALTIQ